MSILRNGSGHTLRVHGAKLRIFHDMSKTPLAHSKMLSKNTLHPVLCVCYRSKSLLGSSSFELDYFLFQTRSICLKLSQFFF